MWKRKRCVNPSTSHPLTVSTLCHLAIKDCQHLKNIHDAFLTASTEREKKINVLENSDKILQSESYHPAASFFLGGKTLQLYLLNFLAKLDFENSEYCEDYDTEL